MRYLELTVGWDREHSVWTGFYRGTQTGYDGFATSRAYGLRLGRLYIYIAKGV